MRVAIMQPYLFPYIGYFQLIDAVDTFVVYDDVNYMKGGWINRNFILSQGVKSRVTLQLLGASQNLMINQVLVGGNQRKILKSVAHSYAKAPQFERVMPLLEKVLMFEEKNLAKYLNFSLREISGCLGLKPKWVVSSDLQKNNSLRGQEKILAICELLHADRYVNAAGGRELYDEKSFEEHNIELAFLEPEPLNYSQFQSEFVPNLSIIDVMMFNSPKECSELLGEYSLVG